MIQNDISVSKIHLKYKLLHTQSMEVHFTNGLCYFVTIFRGKCDPQVVSEMHHSTQAYSVSVFIHAPLSLQMFLPYGNNLIACSQ